MTIQFGTDGWRAVISETFTFANLRLVAQAIADFIREQEGTNPSVIIGFDTRFLSDRYAAEVARVMAANHIQTWLARADTPTPAISYAVVHKNATAGVMITASHNAPRYNGVKLKACYGGSATADQCRRVEQILERNLASGHRPKLMSLQQAFRTDRVCKFDPAWPYYEHLSTLVDLDVIADSELRVVADGMFGSGRGVFGEILARGRTRVRNIRHDINPGFGGIHPEPIIGQLGLLISTIQSGYWDVGLATDGDADRIGAVDARGCFVDPHRIFALVLRYLLEKRGWHGEVVRTVSTTHMIDKLAMQYDLLLTETPVGFNHIAERMLLNGVIMGGEESGGMSIKGHIPEGDGILIGLLLLETLADARAPLHELVDDLLTNVGPIKYARNDIALTYPITKTAIVKMLLDHAPSMIEGVAVEEVQTIDGVKYRLNDGSWLLIRPSGTEPKLRIYAEASNELHLQSLLSFGSDMVSLI